MDNFGTENNLGKKILIADDDPDILEAMQMIFELEGYEVMTTTYGENIPKMSRMNPDLLFLDILMSGVDGRDICKTIKSKNDTKHIPVIMISASEGVAKSVRDAGADDFIAKPFQMNELLDKTAKHLSAN